jgi:hypothetical protein
MQKLSGTSSGKNKKVVGFSPRIQQNWFCIFLNFLRFSTQFTKISEGTLLLKFQIFTKALGLCGLALRKT